MMKKLLNGFLLLLAIMCAAEVLAQEVTISGTVTDQQRGETLPGATITIENEYTGTITDIDGKYTITTEANATLMFSFIGYETQKIKLNGQTRLDIALAADLQSLEEVVVVGYTSKRKKDLVGSVSVVDMEEVGKIVYANPLQALQGRVAGVTFNQTGEPGSVGTSVNIRGFTTFGDNTPLYVIDGIPSQEPPNNLNGNDIASIQVLKDGAASVYGARAAAGVILITTKTGKKDKLEIDAGVIVGRQTRANYLDLLNAEEWGQVYWGAYKNSRNGTPSFTGYFDLGGKPGIPADPQLYQPDKDDPSKDQSYLYTPEGTNWADRIYRDGQSQQYYVNISNGNDKGNVMFGASYFDEQGTIITSYFNRITARLNSNYNLTKWMKVGENLSISNSERVGVGGAANDVVRQHPALPVYDTDGGYAGRVGDFPDIRNTVSQLDRNRNNTTKSWRIFGNAHGEVSLLDALDILPDAHAFKLRTNVGLDYSDYYDDFFESSLHEGVYQIDNNSYFNKYGRGVTLTWNNFAEYSFRKKDHNLTLIGGIESIQYSYRDLAASRTGYSSETPSYLTISSGDDIGVAEGGRSNWGLYSEIARLDYIFKERYLATVLYRHDMTSRFATDGDFLTYMVGWRVTDEPAIRRAIGDNVLNDFKLRASYGELGNQNTGTLHNQSTFYGPNDLNANYDLTGTNTSVQQGFVVLTRGNPFLRWETTKSYNIGADVRLFNKSLDFTFDVYKKVTTDLISNPPLALAIGEGTAPFVNSAQVTNTGFDMSLTHFYRSNSGLKITNSVQVSRYKSVVDDLDDRYPLGYEGERYFDSGGRIAEGRQMREFYGWVADGIFQSTEEVEAHANQTGKGVGRIRYADINGDSIINDEDRTYLGSPHPDVTLGLNSQLKYKNFTLDMFFYSSIGHEIYNNLRVTSEFAQIGTYNRTSAILNSWTPENTDATVPMLTLDDKGNDESRASSYFIEDGTFLKMRTLRLGYNFTPKIFEGFNVNLYAEVQNVFTITNYSGIDPEVPGGFDNGVYPLPRTFILGLNLKL
ncbi:MAG: TonB-dependent receptor [Marinoscillum sp.]|uniref:SusC/RagA family TonB-linked outer membrane protein n=2 Tax=Marinoscillum sp. TaxID=2024838 RepID=UPI0032F2F44D